MADHAPGDDGGVDWRRLASDRNVSHGAAHAMWEQAHAAAPDDPAQAEHAFQLMLGEAEAANVTHEPGRETLAGASPSARDASALGPGKWTRVLLEQPKPAAPAQAEPAGSPADKLRRELAAAGQASKQAAALLAASDPATIVQALRGLAGGPSGGVLHKLVGAASGAVERMLQRSSAPATSAPATSAPAPASAPATPTPTAGGAGPRSR